MEASLLATPVPASTPPPGLSIDTITRRIRAESLKESGIENIRVLNESRFRQILERLVEERLRLRHAPHAKDSAVREERPPPESDALKLLREEYRRKWEEFHSRYEMKLLRLEEELIRAAGDVQPSDR